MPGGSGLQFIKAVTLRATFYLWPIVFPFSHQKSLKIHYVIFVGEIVIVHPFLCRFTIFSYCFSQVSSVTWKITTEYNWTNIIKYSNKEIPWLYSEVLVSTETLKNIGEKLKFWCFRLSKAGLLHRLRVQALTAWPPDHFLWNMKGMGYVSPQ